MYELDPKAVPAVSDVDKDRASAMSNVGDVLTELRTSLYYQLLMWELIMKVR